MDEYIVNVTQDDIKWGEKGKCFDCPVALAIGRTLKKRYRAVSVARDVKIEGCYNNAHMPREVVEWIIKFDSGVDVTPISFKLTILKAPDAPDTPLIEFIGPYEQDN